MAGHLNVDFRPLGLQFVWRDLNHAIISDEVDLAARIQVVDDSQLNVVIVAPVPGAPPALRMANEIVGVPGFPDLHSRIVMNGITYVVRGYRGAGTYGCSAEVEDLATGQRYCLKRQDTAASGNLLGQIHEAMIHYVLYRRTLNLATGISNYVPSIHRMGKQGDILYFLTELMNRKLEDVLEALDGNVGNQSVAVYDFLNQITPKLEFLFNDCMYNHGDFKADNVMTDAMGVYKLIDFGFSRLRLHGRVLDSSEFNNMSEESRDLTQVTKSIDSIVDFRTNYKNRPGMPHLLYFVLKVRLLKRCICDGKDGDHAPHLKNFNSVPWLRSYEWFNAPIPGQVGNPNLWRVGHRNVAGTFEAMRGYLQWVVNLANYPNPTLPIPITADTDAAEAILFPGVAPAGPPPAAAPAAAGVAPPPAAAVVPPPPPPPPAAAVMPPPPAAAVMPPPPPPAAAVMPPPPAAVAVPAAAAAAAAPPVVIAVAPLPAVPAPGPGAPAPLPAPVEEGILGVIANNAGLVVAGLALGAAYLFFPFVGRRNEHEGGRRVVKKLKHKRKTRKNRRVNQRKAYVSRKTRSRR